MTGTQTACLNANATPSPLRQNLDYLLACFCHNFNVIVSISNTQFTIRIIYLTGNYISEWLVAEWVLIFANYHSNVFCGCYLASYG